MDIVEFIHTEDSGNDQILSFSFKEGTEFGVDGFIIQRSPKFEFGLRPDEKGPAIDWTAEDERINIKEVTISKKIIRLRTKHDIYSFDLGKLSDTDIKRIIDMFNKMNFDNVFKFSVV